jgi:hypothetical protein
MNNAITYTNTASTVTFTFGSAAGVLASVNGKVEVLSPNQAEDFIEALEEAGYRRA